MALFAVPLAGEIHEWTNNRGQKIQAEFISATEKTVTISMQGKTYVVKLADLTPQSRALAAKLGGQKSTAQKPGAKVGVDLEKLERRDGFRYFEGKPFTGVAVQKYPNGQKEYEGTYKDGKLNGLWTKWYENGQKKEETTFKDGNLVTATVWKPNGEKCPDTNVVNGNGIMCWYHDNGQKRGEATFKDGKLISAKQWDKDGNLVTP